MDAKKSCSTCKFWSQDTEQCRINPPQLVQAFSGGFIYHGTDDAETAWPETSANDWCGQHKTLDA
jgi:hypothetical protein